MTIDELAGKLMDKSSEVFQEHEDEMGRYPLSYHEGWSDALKWVARRIMGAPLGELECLELRRPIVTGSSRIDGVHKNYFKFPPGWSEEEKENWRREHGG